MEKKVCSHLFVPQHHPHAGGTQCKCSLCGEVRVFGAKPICFKCGLVKENGRCPECGG